MSRISVGRVGALISRRYKQLQRKSQQRNYRKLFQHRPGMEGLEPRLMLARDLLVADIVTDSILRFNGDTGAPLGAFVTSGSGGLVDPLDPEFGPDGNLYVLSIDPGHVKVLRYDGSSGAPLGTFVDLGGGSASAIEFGPDGNLYLATVSDAGVLRFNGTTGQPMGVAASGNGIRRAGGISFGPDGKLYVLDSDSVINTSADRVLRFDLNTGAFIDQFVAPGQLNDALYLTFGPDNQLYVPDIQHFHDVRRFNGTTGAFLGVFANSPDPSNNPIFDIQFGPDGNAYAATGGGILRLDGETGRLLDTFVDGTGGSITFFPPVGPATDLSVSSIDIPVGVVQGNDLSITYTITNNSASATVVNSWDDVVYLSTDDVFDPSDQELGRIARTTGLAGGASYSETVTASLPSVSLGDYHVFVFADRRGVVNDPARLNNLLDASNTLEVFPPLASTHDPNHSIAVGRTLSAYTTKDIVNNSLTITYTVYNLTDGYVKGTLLTTTLGTGVTLVSATMLPDRNGQNLAWSLGVVAPYGRTSVELVVSLAASNPLRPDAGPRAFGMLDTVAVKDTLPPVVLRTDAIDPALLASTPDANTNDPFIQERAAELDYDPNRIFGFLTQDVGYESYVGSLRGARGTLWSSAGNSLDEASLGIALLRSSGIPSKYAQGTLSDPLAQQLILSMFPSSFQTVGYIPSGTQTSDPVNDPKLLNETKQHYWIQFDAGAGFQDADSGFENATIGQTFAALQRTFVTVADSLRYKAEIRLNAEVYNTIGSFFSDSNGLPVPTTVFEHTFNVVDLVGKPLSIGHIVSRSGLSAIFTAVTNTYAPFLNVGDVAYADGANDTIIRGSDYQEVLTNFPFGTQIVTGLFISISTTGPDGSRQNYERSIVDRIDFATRSGIASVPLNIDSSGSPILTGFEVFSMNFLPALQDETIRTRLAFNVSQLVTKLNADLSNLYDSESASNRWQLLAALSQLELANIADASDRITKVVGDVSGVKAYFDRPRITAVSIGVAFDETVDLIEDRIRAQTPPGQNLNAVSMFNGVRGFKENGVETVAPILSPENARISTEVIIDLASNQGIPLVTIASSNAEILSTLDISAEAKARITLSLGRGELVVVPAASPSKDGRKVIGWYEIDPLSGHLYGVLENGTHGGEIAGYSVSQEGSILIASRTGLILKPVEAARAVEVVRKSTVIADRLKKELDALQVAKLANKKLIKELVKGALASISALVAATADLPIGAKILIATTVPFIGSAIRLIAGDPPVPNWLSTILVAEPPESVAFKVEKLSSRLTAGSIDGNVSTAAFSVSGQLSAEWNSNKSANLEASALMSDSATLIDSLKRTVGSGKVEFEVSETVNVNVSGINQYKLVGNGALSFYTQPTSNRGVSGEWKNYTADISGNVSIEITTDKLKLNGVLQPLGSYTITTDAIKLSGAGSTASPSFSELVSVVATQSTVHIGAGTGEVHLGGNSISPTNDIAVTDFTGILNVAAGVNTDSVGFTGKVGQILSVASDSAVIIADQNNPAVVSFQAQTSIAGDYTYVVVAPKNWGVEFGENGKVNVSVAPGTQQGSFPIRLIAQSRSNPELIVQSEKIVTVAPTTPGLTFKVESDMLLTVPFADTQLPSSFRATVHNLGPTSDRFQLMFSDVPDGFRILNTGMSVTIPAGQDGIVGLYLQPLAGQPLPPPGLSLSFTVTAVSMTNPTITKSQVVTFVVPNIHSVTLISNPSSVTVVPGQAVDLTFTVVNTGNVPESVNYSVTNSNELQLSRLESATLGVGQKSTQILTVIPSQSAPLNTTLSTIVTAIYGSNGSEVSESLQFRVRVAVPGADAIANASIALAQFGSTDLANRLNDLSIALTNLVQNPNSVVFKAQSVAALDTAIALMQVDANFAGFVPKLIGPKSALMAAQTPSEIQAAVSSLGAALDGFGATVTALAKSNFELFLQPNSQVALPQTPAQFELRVHNIGTDTSTYNVALQGVPAGVTATLSDQQVTLDRDAMATVMVTLTQDSANELVEFGFSVDVAVDGAAQISKSASGTLTARREFVSVVSVTATPPFTDAGGTLEVSARLLNAVNREQKARASFVVRDSTGTQVGASSSPVDVTLTVQTSLVTLPLGSIDTTALANGSYSIVLTLVDMAGAAIPGGTGSTTFLVGSPLTASIDATPSVLPPGTSTVTNSLNIEALAPLVSPPSLVGQAAVAGASDVVRNGDIVYVAGSSGISVFDIAGANLQNPQLLRSVGPATTLLEKRGDLLVSVLSRPGGGSTTLTTYSLSDPANPTQLGTTGDIPYGTAADLLVTDTHAFIVLVNIIFTFNRDIIDQNGGLIAINISNPSTPFFDGDAVSAKGTPAGRDGVNDGVLFNDNGTNNDGIKNPLGIDQSGGNQNTWSVVQVSPTTLLLSGSTATGTDTQSGAGVVRVVDISDPRNMRLLRDLQIPGTVHVLDVAVSGNRALLTASQGGLADLTVGFPFTGNVVLATLNISDPANPQIIHQQTLDRAARGVDHATALDNGLFAISNLGATTDKPGLFIVDASDPNNVGIGGMDVPAGINELTGGDGSIFTTDGASLIVYQVPSNSPLTLVGQVPISGGLRGVAARDNIAYASGTGGIQVIDYSDPTNPVDVGTIPGNHVGARIQDNVLLALRPSGVGFILDVYALQNTPLAPPLIGSSPVIKYNLQTDLKSDSGHAYVTQFQTCFFLGSQDIYFQGGDLISIALNLDDVANPTTAAPTLDSVLFNTNGDASPDPRDVSGCAQNGGDNHVTNMELVNASTAYLATTSATGGNTQLGVGRIGVIDISDTTNPTLLKNLDIPGTVEAIGVGVSGNVGVVIGSTGGFADNPQGILLGNLTVTTLDVSDPHDPKIITTRTLDRGSETFWSNFVDIGNGIFGFSNLGYHNGQSNPAVVVIDASNPRSPLIGQVSIPNDLIAPNSLSTDGKFLFTADSGGVSIYTVNPLPGLPVTARVQIPNGTGVTPIPGSFNIPPAEVISGADFDTYVFDLTLTPSLPSEKLTWQTAVVGLQPGESRSVTLGTTVDFAFQGTAGQVALPRTVVAAEQVLSLAPTIQTVRPGGEADYTVTFTNPSTLPVTYSLSIGGVPSQWVSIDSTMTVPAGGTATKSLRLATGAFDVVGEYGFLVNAVVDSVTTSVAGTLMLVGAPILPDAKPESQGVVVSLSPTSAIAGQGTAATYVARLTNVGSQADNFMLSIAGLPSGFQATFALDSVNVPPGFSNFREVLLTVTPPQDTDAGDYLFTVTATSVSDPAIADDATSTLSVLDIGVAVDVTPESGSPESTYQMLVTNIGQVRETFDLSLAAPAALMATLGVSSVTLEPGQSTSVPIDVGAIDFAFPGALSLVGVATSRSNPLVRAADGVGVDIAGLLAMTATFDKSTQILPLPGTSSFLLLVDNIGNIEDQYSATIKSTSGPVTANLVGLQGERTQSVPLFILPGLSRGAILLNAELLSAGLGTIIVTVKSLTDDSVSTEITAQLQAGEQTEPIADLSLVMTVDNASAKVGQNVTFTVALNNAGPDGATGVNVLDKLPAGLQFVSATTSSGSYSATTGLWNVGSLAQGATTTLTIVATLLTDQAVSNVAQVATSDQRDPDSTPGNNVDGEDDQFSAGVGTCLTGGPLVAGMNRLVFSCVTPGGFAAFVVGSQPGSHHYSQWGTTVDIADPGVPAIGVGNINGVAVVLVSLTQAQLAHPLYVQAFEMLPAHKVSNLIVAQHTPEKTGTPLVADTIGLGTSSNTLAALQAGTPALKAAALARWQAAGVSELLLEHLAAIDILFSDLPNDQLAATQGNFIVLDANAAGHGWFVDTTPGNDAEFTRDASGAMLANTDTARDHIDALTVILHEMGHVLGEPDEPTGSVNRLMSESLAPGARRLPTSVTTPSLGALDVNHDGLVTPMDVLLIINELNLASGRMARTTVAGNVLDVTGDGLLTPIDALQVINYLNHESTLKRSSALAEGERNAAGYDNDGGIYNAVESPLIDESLLEALAADALNAWLEAQRTSRLKSSGHL